MWVIEHYPSLPLTNAHETVRLAIWNCGLTCAWWNGIQYSMLWEINPSLTLIGHNRKPMKVRVILGLSIEIYHLNDGFNYAQEILSFKKNWANREIWAVSDD